MPSSDIAAVLFVYGTLKRGGSNQAQMAGQRLLGRARSGPGWALYSLGEYPGLVEEPGDNAGVSGELWAVDEAALARLDEFEGVDEGLYARRPVRLAEWSAAVPAEVAARAETYVYLRPVDGRVRLGDHWPVAVA